MPDFKIQLPEFQNEILQQLYKFHFLSRELLTEILELPHDSLIADLELLLKDAIKNHEVYYEEEFESLNFAIHAFFLLKQLKSKASLSLIFEFLTLEEEYIEFYFGDILCEDVWSVLYELGKHDLEQLLHFMIHVPSSTYTKTEVAVAVSQIAFQEPERRAAVLSWFEKVLEHYTSLKNEDIDETLIGLVICSVMDIKATSLLPLIKKLYDLQFVEIQMNGNWKEVEAEMLDEFATTEPRKNLDIFSFYEDWQALLERNAFVNDQWLNNQIRSKQTPIVSEQKIGRNDPCPCGSGKKYKKCCLNN